MSAEPVGARNVSNLQDDNQAATMNTAQRTIEDFGAQWTRYRSNEAYYGSTVLLQDILGPLLTLDEIAGCRVADIGSGTGRIVRMLLGAGARHVIAVEPSAAMAVLQDNTREDRDRITYICGKGEALPADAAVDLIFSIGVLHHIPDPDPVIRAAFAALRPGGRILIWVYGREGNEAYLRWAIPLRRITCRLPDLILAPLCHGANALLGVYAWMCRFLSLPLAPYMRGHVAKLSWSARYLTIFDQLNPAEARYYRESEARALLERAGFLGARTHHRHGYSWTVVGVKPSSP